MENIFSYSRDLHEYIISEAYHPYLRRYLNEPVIEEQKLLLLILILNELNIPEEDRKQYITATLLVQAALDVHNDVTSPDGHAENDALKLRQLTVLAGDYYSGLYYSLLAETENNDLIRLLSEGIMDVNEKKIIFYEQHYSDLASLLDAVKVIEAALIVKLEECFTVPRYRNFIENFLLLERLKKERQAFIEKGDAPFYQALSGLLFSEKLASLAEEQIESLKQQAETIMQEVQALCIEELHQQELKGSSVAGFYAGRLAEEPVILTSNGEEG
ncbi:heptaprenyl diphosphate synthase component 1 [Bacillus testis]|uniref:heptaprenyl diphosphate synthase component 1 n=1 Tax=Bacillus testis TaxID=1622072 RepID=UPI00067F69CF|nr:heptaprenyl diphosphate synthase component 1 [Bacillus testis]